MSAINTQIQVDFAILGGFVVSFLAIKMAANVAATRNLDKYIAKPKKKLEDELAEKKREYEDLLEEYERLNKGAKSGRDKTSRR